MSKEDFNELLERTTILPGPSTKDNKVVALYYLQKALECGTRENISKLTLNEDQETVTVLYDNDCSFKVNVACDSACCMLLNVMILLNVMKAIGDRL